MIDAGHRWAAWVLTLFPELFPGPLGASLAGKALADRLWRLETLDIREFATDKHRSVDDSPFGGGPGMVMRADVVAAAIDAARKRSGLERAIFLSPRGRLFEQALAEEFAAEPGVILLCGRYEGVDQRVLEARKVEEISLGDYVLSSGEPAAICLIDACVRLLPGVVGRAASLAEESFAEGLLEYPHYTRPEVWEGRAVPEILLSGHHERIRAWRQGEAERTTKERRADLWERYAGRTDKAKKTDKTNKTR